MIKALKRFKVLFISALAVVVMLSFVACANKKQYTVTFVTNGGSAIEQYSLVAGKEVTEPDAPVKDLFTFDGWYADEDLTVKFDFGQPMPENDIKIYAAWTPFVNVKIDYETNGGSDVESSIGKVGAAFIQPDDPTKDGYAFGGWFIDREFTQPFEFTVYPEDGCTLYAKWINDPSYVYVTFYGNGEKADVLAVKKGGNVTEPELFGDALNVGWFTDAALTSAYTFGGTVNSNLSLYTAYYSEGLVIDGGVVTDYIGSSRNVVVPHRFGGVAVTKIGDRAFLDSDATSVTLPSTVTEIGKEAFYGCRYLTQINISTAVNKIGEYAFFNNERLVFCGDISAVTEIPDGLFIGCKKLADIKLGAQVTSIGKLAFSDCLRLTEMSVPSRVRNVSDYMFSGCTSLKSVALPAAMTNLGTGVFDGCKALSSVTIASANSRFKVIDGNIYRDKDFIRYIRGDKTETEFTLPADVTKIEKHAFEMGEGIKKLTVSGVDTVLECGSLKGLDSLENLSVPSFAGVNNESGFLAYLFGATTEQMSGSQSYFVPENLTDLTVTSRAVTKISDYAFFGVKSLVNINWSNEINAIGEYAFAFTTLTSFTFPKALETLSYTAFVGCENLKTFAVEEGSVNFDVYDNCLYNKTRTELRLVPTNATTIAFPTTLSSIGDYAAMNCDVAELVIPDTVTKVGYGAFMDCDKLKKLTIPSIPEIVNDDAGTDNYMAYIFGAKISSSKNSDGYTSASISNYERMPIALEEVHITSSYTAIPDFAFAFIPALTTIDINGDITSYGAFSFYGTNLSSIDLTGATKIGEYAFASCDFEELVVPGTVTLSNGCFAYNAKLKSITLGEGITEIPDGMLYCDSGDENPDSSLNTLITIPKTVTRVGNNAFVGAGVHYLNKDEYEVNEGFDIQFAEGSVCEEIGNYAFYMAGLTHFAVPSTVKRIGDFAFYWCDFMQDITVGDKANGSAVEYIGMWSFAYCKALKSFTIYASVAPELPVLVATSSSLINYAGTRAFYGSAYPTINVPEDALNAYKFADGWSYYLRYIEPIASEEEGGEA